VLAARKQSAGRVDQAGDEAQQGRWSAPAPDQAGKPIPPAAALDDPLAALKKNRNVMFASEPFSAIHGREHHEWISDARRGEICQRRLAQAIAWLSAGKSGRRQIAQLEM